MSMRRVTLTVTIDNNHLKEISKCVTTLKEAHVDTVLQVEVEEHADSYTERSVQNTDYMVKTDMVVKRKTNVNTGTLHCVINR